MECTKNIYLPGVGKKTLAGDEGTRVCPGHPLPVPQDHPCPTGPALPLALSRLLPPSGTSEALGLLRPHAALSTGCVPAVPLCCSCNSACWHLSVLKACPDQQPDIRKE